MAYSNDLDPVHAAPPKEIVQVGAWKLSVAAIAWTSSILLHAGFLTASYYASPPAGLRLPPQIRLARGDHAVTATIVLTPWPQSSPAEDGPPVSQDAPTPSEQPTDTPCPIEPPSPTDLPAVDVFAAADNAEETDGPPQPTSEIRAPPPTEKPSRTSDPDTPTSQTAFDEDQTPAAQEATPGRPATPATSDGKITNSTTSNEKSKNPPAPDVTNVTPTANNDPRLPRPDDRPEEPKRGSSPSAGVATGVAVLNLPHPTYPSASRRRGEEGLVMLLVEVLPDGAVGTIDVLRDPGHPRLVRSAAAAARKARFRPATRDGRPIRAVVRIPFRFVLR
ncbi:MAG: TonB family protein [Phycisphaerae bacterium]